MYTESKKHLILIKQALIEKRTNAEHYRDEMMSQDPRLSEMDVINEIIETSDELIDAIDNELPDRGKTYRFFGVPNHNFLNLIQHMFIEIGWETERQEFDMDFASTLTLKKPIDFPHKKREIYVLTFSDLEGNKLADMVSYDSEVQITEKR